VTHPFELGYDDLRSQLEAMVDVTMADLESEFLLMPQGGAGFVDYPSFQAAYEVLKAATHGFSEFTAITVERALLQDSRTFVILRAILGMTAPEWGELARSESAVNVTQGASRSMDQNCRRDPKYLQRLLRSSLSEMARTSVTAARLQALVTAAVNAIRAGAPPRSPGMLHRLDKFDTALGLDSVHYVAAEGAPYSVLLYERYLGRPFASHRDAVSELVGEVMENAIEERLRAAGVTLRKTKRAERIPGFGQAPDFCIPDELNPAVVIEAKITSDDGTARDKVTRIKALATQRDAHVAAGWPSYEVVACVDGRGFKQRREDMRQMLLALDGKVFTTATLDRLLEFTRLRNFVTAEARNRDEQV